MRDPFGFISYRVGPSPSIILSTVWWSLAIILVVTVGVQAGSSALIAVKGALGKSSTEPSSTNQGTGDYEIEEAISEDEGGSQTFEATPYESGDKPTDLSGKGRPPMPNTDKPVPAAL